MSLFSCPDCGNPVSTEAVSCPHCGRPIKQPPQKKKTHRWIVPVVIAAVLLLAVAAYLFFFTNVLAVKEPIFQFEQSDGSLMLRPSDTISNEYLTEAQAQTVDLALREAVKVYNEMRRMEPEVVVPLDYDDLFMEYTRSDVFSTAPPEDPKLQKSALLPLLDISAQFAMLLFTSQFDSSSGDMLVSEESMGELKTSILAALEYYYHGNAEPVLLHLGGQS